MPNTYSQISIQAVFAVRRRENFIIKPWRDELHQYIAGIITELDGKSLAVGGWKDHVHLFFALPTSMSIADLVQTVKTNSSKWINDRRFTHRKFNWQESYGAFSYSKSQRDNVIRYIINQEIHHKEVSFQTEYIKMLKNFDIAYNEKYLFEFFD